MATDDTTRRKRLVLGLAGAVAALLLAGVLTVGPVHDYLFGEATPAADDEAKKKEEEKKEKLPDFSLSPPVVWPGDPASLAQAVKPGHWTTTSQQMRANYRDFVGESLVTLVDKENDPYPLARTPFAMQSTRSVALSKGTPKNIETTVLVPKVTGQVRLATDLEEHALGGMIRQPPANLTRMPSYQYYFVVLAKEPSQYSYVKTLDSVLVPFDGESEMDDTEDALHYRVKQLAADGGPIELSDNALTWTSIAYLLWDEVDPQQLTPEQQRALVDWLHWGGELIVSGPDSLDLLRGSFLQPYLPATSTGSREIGAGDLAALNDGWAIPNRGAPGASLAPQTPWAGIGLKARAGAQPLWSTGGLLVERAVGRGRVIVSAMRLSEWELVNWRGFQSLFNACVLRRPPRVYRPGYYGDVTLAWADEDLADRRLDARLTTNLRYFARDEGVATSYRWIDMADTMAMSYGYGGGAPSVLKEYKAPAGTEGGIGAWNDFSDTSQAARAALREAAGVDVPGASFVVTCLVVYLLALVPLNWFIFHTLGRVEWAWVAAPLIAVVGTYVIVDRARLDIGFVRAQTEIGLVELQPEYDRGHLTRFTSLYTSLSTTYDVETDNGTTLVAPFPARRDFKMLTGQRREAVDFRPYEKTRLAGLPVASNSANMVHSEQMIGLDGPIGLGRSSIGRAQLENRCQFRLDSVGIVERAASGDALRGTWIGELRPGQSVALGALPPLLLKQDEVPFAAERAAEAELAGGERLNLEPMFALAYHAAHLEPGEMRLVGRLDEVLPGQTISPAASQVRAASLVVAHLRYAPLADPRSDVNTRQDVKRKSEDLND